MHSPAARDTLARAVAELNDLVVFGGLDDEQSTTLERSVRALLETHGGTATTGPASLRWREYRRRSPFSGSENPRAPGLSMALPGREDRSRAIGTVTLSSSYAGAPSIAHGGVIAGLFDEAIGWLSSAHDPEGGFVTGRLTVRYRRPAPLDTELAFSCEVERRRGRRLHVTAACRQGGLTLATAEALMVAAR
ncbi:MAG: PaaI family thioesterase [Actinomycetota bacterium]